MLTGKRERRFSKARDLVVLVASIALGAEVAIFAVGEGTFAIDALIYHDAWSVGLYSVHPIIGQIPGFIYTPAAAFVVWPLGYVPRLLFVMAYDVAALAAYAWLLRPLSWHVRAPLLALAIWPIYIGNIEWLLALVVVFGFRYPALYAIPLLTKVRLRRLVCPPSFGSTFGLTGA